MITSNLRNKNALLILLAVLAGTPVWAQSSPTPFTTSYRYDASGRLTGIIRPPDSSTATAFLATRKTYNSEGLIELEEEGWLSAWPGATGPAAWSGFNIVHASLFTYDDAGRKTSVRVTSGGATYLVTQFEYDEQGLLKCSAQRMNPSTFNALPTSACVASTPEGTFGPDRITYTSYDALGRTSEIQKAYGTTSAYTFAKYTYYSTGVQQGIADGNGNYSQYEYDGLVRLKRWYFPSTTVTGSHNTADYEEYGYDPRGNRTSLRKRDNVTIVNSYDALNRITGETYSNGARSAYFGHDLRNLQLYARYDSPSGPGLTQTYDGFGNLFTSTTNLSGVSLTLTHLYDGDGNRIRLTHPDGQFFKYTYDGLNRLRTIEENGATTILTEAYDQGGRKQSRSRGANVSTTMYTYDAISRIQTLTHDFSGSAYDEARTYSYNPANQLISRDFGNSIYAFAQASSVSLTYTANGLNQYSTISAGGSVTPTYDGNGNTKFDGSIYFSYDALNRLISTSGGKLSNQIYDPKGRLQRTSGGASGTTNFLYDGDSPVIEYDGNNAIMRRYVHTNHVDDVVVTYEGASVSPTTRRFIHADEHGSVSAVTDASGSALTVNSYDVYGLPATSNTGRFQFTGQMVLPDLGFYIYKTRVYSAGLGRFLQVDTIGYKDDANLYAYVKNDPLNKSDPSGKDSHSNCLYSWCYEFSFNNYVKDQLSAMPTEARVAAAKLHPRLDTPDEEEYFRRWLQGKGNKKLSEGEFAAITSAAVVVGKGTAVTLTNGQVGEAVPVSLYHDKRFDFSIGSATLFRQNGKYVGFFDSYDFDTKPLGQRGIGAELATRAVGAGAQGWAYNICFGATAQGSGC